MNTRTIQLFVIHHVQICTSRFRIKGTLCTARFPDTSTFLWRWSPNRASPRFEVFTSHNIRHRHRHTHTHGRSPLNQWSARRRGSYLHNTQQMQETNIHAISGIWTRDTSKLVAADLRLRSHGHRERLLTHR
jgi:hypothetical protein